MQKILVFISFTLLMSCNSSKTTSTNEAMTLKVLYTADYCGGAYPSDEILEDLKRPKPLANEKIYVKKAGENANFLSFQTNEQGEFSASFAEGKFQVFLKEKIAAKDCEEWSAKSNGTFTVSKDSDTETINIHRTCNPCDEPSR